MAYLVRRPDGRVEIREALATPAGPRSRTLASGSPPLGPELFERAARRARRGFDRERLLARARALGIAIAERREAPSARALLAELRAGASLDPVLVTLLRDALAALPAEPVPAALADVAEWVDRDDAARGAALRDLLRVSDRVVRSREPVRKRRERPFPRFASRRAARAKRG
jgi:hypothetical protein